MTDQVPDFFSDLEVIADSRSYFDLMRASGPIMREPYRDTLIVTGFDEALEILNDKMATFSNACSVVGPIPGLPFTPASSDIREQLEAHRGEMPWNEHLVCMDGKRHQDHRMLLGGLLTYKRLRRNEEYLHSLADRLIDGFAGTGALCRRAGLCSCDDGLYDFGPHGHSRGRPCRTSGTDRRAPEPDRG